MNSAAFIAAQPIMIQRAKLISNATITALLPFYVSLEPDSVIFSKLRSPTANSSRYFRQLTNAGVWERNARVARNAVPKS